jgi:hypothetical protein
MDVEILDMVSDWEQVRDGNLDLTDDLMTEWGPLSQIRMQNGNHLVMKVVAPPMTSGSNGVAIALTQQTRKTSVGNLSMIRGLVVKGSESYRRRRSKKYFIDEYDPIDNIFKPKLKWRVTRGNDRFPAGIQTGDAIIYNSYNLGRLRVDGLVSPLVIVREMDILATFPRELMDQITVGDNIANRGEVAW